MQRPGHQQCGSQAKSRKSSGTRTIERGRGRLAGSEIFQILPWPCPGIPPGLFPCSIATLRGPGLQASSNPGYRPLRTAAADKLEQHRPLESPHSAAGLAIDRRDILLAALSRLRSCFGRACCGPLCVLSALLLPALCCH